MSTAPAPARDDLYTVMAIATLAACTSDLAHEALGHGSACLLAGHRIAVLNNAFFQCSAGSRWTAVAGPLSNLATGLIAFAALRFVPARRPALRLYALLVMAFSVFWEAGYLIQAMIKDTGDSVFAYREWIGPESLTVRAVAVVIGVAAYLLFARLLMLRAAVFSNVAGRLRRLLRPSWATGVAAMALAGLLYAPDRFGAAHDAGLSIVASFPLLFVRAAETPPSESAALIGRSATIIVVGLAVWVAFALTMGRGMTF